MNFENYSYSSQKSKEKSYYHYSTQTPEQLFACFTRYFADVSWFEALLAITLIFSFPSSKFKSGFWLLHSKKLNNLHLD